MEEFFATWAEIVAVHEIGASKSLFCQSQKWPILDDVVFA